MKNKIKYNVLSEKNFYLTDSDFYPPEDNRTLKSNIYDIYKGDTFEECAKEIFDLYESEDYYEN